MVKTNSHQLFRSNKFICRASFWDPVKETVVRSFIHSETSATQSVEGRWWHFLLSLGLLIVQFLNVRKWPLQRGVWRQHWCENSTNIHMSVQKQVLLFSGSYCRQVCIKLQPWSSSCPYDVANWHCGDDTVALLISTLFVWSELLWGSPEHFTQHLSLSLQLGPAFRSHELVCFRFTEVLIRIW